MREIDVRREPFTLHDGVLVAEASDCGFSAGFQSWHALERIWLVDANGKREPFYFYKTDLNGDEYAGWRFKPCDRSSPIREVLIIND